jgi:hypothetical protein
MVCILYKSMAVRRALVTDLPVLGVFLRLQWLEVCTKLELTVNTQLHLQGDVCAGWFTYNLLNLGEGTLVVKSSSRLTGVQSTLF